MALVLIPNIAPGGGGVTDGDKGDVVVSVGGTVWLIDAAYTAAVLALADAAADAGDVAYAAPLVHASRHQAGGADPVKLDDLAAPDDNVDLNASTSAHGLMMKYPGGTTNFLRSDGTFAAPVSAAGDFDWRLTANSSIAANKTRTFASEFQIEDTFALTIEDGGALAVI